MKKTSFNSLELDIKPQEKRLKYCLILILSRLILIKAAVNSLASVFLIRLDLSACLTFGRMILC